MPKGGLDRSGTCGTFSGHASLTAEDIAVFSRWVDGGMPEGTSARAPNPPESPSGDFATSQRSFVAHASVTLPEPYWPAADESGRTGDHRCFALSASDVAGTPMSAFRVVPSAPEIVHHVLLFGLDTPADTAKASELDESDPGPGWGCFGSSGVAGARLLGAWAPGASVVGLPPGFAVRLGTLGLVAQVHYDGPAAERPDQTKLELETAGAGARDATYLPFAATDLTLPPGRESVHVARVGALDLDRDALVLGLFPHMHALGRSLRLGASDARNGDRCLANVRRWDYRWQEVAFYVEAEDLPFGALLSIDCEYSTLGVKSSVTWGERAEDEMCMAFVIVGN
jgi:hypothetical protein